MSSSSDLPVAVDLRHHLSTLSKSRAPSPLKDIFHYMFIPNMISLAGGLPHPSLFPFHSISASTYPASTVIDPASPTAPAAAETLTVSRDVASAYPIPTLLQYSSAAGHARLLAFYRELTLRLGAPAYADWTVLGNAGSTDGWHKVAQLLLEPGDHVICEEQTYPSAQAAYIPMGVRSAPVAVDGEGMVPAALDALVASWDPARGRRPHVLYLVPVGQNPLGTTMREQRRRELYAVAEKHDLVIVEDDPYSALQYAPYELGGARVGAHADDPAAFIYAMAKSFLTLDTQGRVIRLDTFSKVLAPGARLGWFTCNAMFAERLVRATEVTTQAPSGFSQMMIGQLLEQWGVDGYLTWLTNLKEQYRVRRDWMLDAIAEHFDVVPASSTSLAGAEGLVVYPKGQAPTGPPMLSLVPPTGGMFLWCKVYYSTNPAYTGDLNAFERVFWKRLTDALVLVTPGWYYAPYEGEGVRTLEAEVGVGHFRLAFSYETKPDMEEGIRRLAAAMTAEWLAKP
ncbi:Aromatic/aminoadipate aminotransferase 1 [Cryptotrichosporon argae]